MRHPIIESSLLTPAAILFGSIIIAGAIVTSVREVGRSQPTVATAAAPAQYAQQPAAATTGKKVVDVKTVDTVGEPYVGSLSSPVTMAYWYDYQCPFCQRNEQEVISKLVTEYVNTGKLRIVFKDFQFLGADSQAIGKVSRAVWDTAPGKFYAWHKAMFDAQGRENSGWATQDKLRSIATEVLGADVANKVLALAIQNSALYQKEMDADKAEANSFGISGTPSSVIGKTLVNGARPYDNFTTVIDASLAGK